MPHSEPPSPIHGFDSNSRPVTAELEDIEDLISPVRRFPLPNLERQGRVERPLDTPRRSRRPSSSSFSSDENLGEPRSRTSSRNSLSWDEFNEDPSYNVHNLGRSDETNFNVTIIDASVSESRVERVNKHLTEKPEQEQNSSPNTSEESICTMVNTEKDKEPAEATGPNAGDVTEVETPTVIPVECKPYMKVLKRADTAWEDDFQPVSLTAISMERLQKKLDRAEQYKDDLTDAILELDDLGHDFWLGGVSRGARILKTRYVQFINAADQVLHAQGVIADGSAAKEVKTARVKKHLVGLVTNLDTVREELRVLNLGKPVDEPSYLLHHEQVTQFREKGQTLLEEAKALVDDATDAGLSKESEQIDTAMRKLRDTDRETSINLLDKKSGFGLIGGGTSRYQRSDVPVPKFSGNPNEADYYTFLKEWQQYTVSKVMSEAEKFRVLTRTCLTGPALGVSRRFETIPEVLEHLKVTFGNPTYLFASKLDDIRKLGVCNGSDTKRRDWVVDVNARLHDVFKLAESHQLLEKLYNCSIVGEVQDLMTSHMVKQFKKSIKKLDKLGNTSSKSYWDALCTFLTECTDDLTFEINYVLNTGSVRSDVQSSKPRETSRRPTQKVYSASVAVADDDSEDSDPGPIVKPVKKAKNSKRGGGKIKQNFANAQVTISANYVEPASVPCLVCNKNHKYMFECEYFQAARGPDRIAVAAQMKLCFRCLRLDSTPIDLKNREAWWNVHEPNCKTTWVCTYGKCPNIESMKQFHMLMCNHHFEQNKEKERAFIADMDQKFVSPGLRFFFNQAMFQLDSQPILPSSPDENILDDTSAPSIFMLQNIEQDGRNMLMFYDSGCGGAALSDRAAEILHSVCVREGPTLLNVAGGTTLKIDRGDESFRLALDGSDKMATMTGLRMPDVTSKFPVWDIAGAWEDVMNELDRNYPAHDPVPPAPATLGGCPVDLMVGIRYIRYFPNLLYMLPSGLGVYKSQFAAPNGETCVLGGPHKTWAKAREASNLLGPHQFFSNEMKAYYFACATLRHVYSPSKTAPSIEHAFMAHGDSLKGEVEGGGCGPGGGSGSGGYG